MQTPNHDNQKMIAETRNTPRFFTQSRQLAWVLLVFTLLWGAYSYWAMPKRKDPTFRSLVAVVVCPWPGVSAEKIEQQVARKLEEKIAQNVRVDRIETIARNNVATIYLFLDERVKDVPKEFDDIRLKLDSIRDLPPGAGPIEFLKDFGETAALMLTVAGPPADEIVVKQRAVSVRAAIERTRANLKPEQLEDRAALIVGLPPSLPPERGFAARDLLARWLKEIGFAGDVRQFEGTGFIGLDLEGVHDDEGIIIEASKFLRNHLPTGFQPDVWRPAVIRQLDECEASLRAAATDKYSYRELDEYTDLIARTLQTVPLVSKVTRAGTLKERVFLDYSQDRLAAYSLQTTTLRQILGARNITGTGGVLEVAGKSLGIAPSGEFKSEKEIGETVVSATADGSPVYARDIVDISRGYEDPPRFLNYYTWRDANGRWQRTRSITLAVSLRQGEQIAEFGQAVDETLANLKPRLPRDLILARTSDQPLQVKEGVSLFTRSLIEAVLIVIFIALIGFREWRSAALIAASIPLTLAMTFGMMRILGLDIQQVSIASLIIALGLLVDDPVVANDAIKREIAAGIPAKIAAWLGPTKLAKAIFYATITNIVAYLPLLLVEGQTGDFISTLPVVIACSLVASRIVSMTFVPLLAWYLLRPGKRPERTLEEQKQRGFAGFYYRLGLWSLENRWKVVAFSLLFLVIGGFSLRGLRRDFFPKDLSYLAYVDVYLPEDAPLSATNNTAQLAERIITETAQKYGSENPGRDGKPRNVLESLTTFAGGGGPRFWYSLAPELPQLNYAQIVIQTKDKRDTSKLVAPLQQALSAKIPGARIDVRQLEIGKAIGVPVAVRISGEDIATLRRYAEEMKEIFRSAPIADRVRDNWGAESFVADLQVDADKANLANVTNLDVAASSATSINGLQVTTLREGDQQIPVVVRLRPEERAQLSDLQNLYVYSMMSANRVPLRQISKVDYRLETARIARRNQFRTITVSCLPVPGKLPSEVMALLQDKIDDFAQRLPPGYKMEIGGEQGERVKGFKQLGLVMLISTAALFLALTVQFKNAIKPLLVFSAIPFGLIGALAALVLLGTPFGFMAFLGIASLIGVIVSHVIVLFDFVEEKREEGVPLRQALLDSGVARLRPVFITVGATIFGLVPLALNGGPLWEALCYAQIGGLALSNYATKLLVPALYTICVEDLKLIRWGQHQNESTQERQEIEAIATA